MKKVQIEFDELPFSTLERFGLTREMIEDLPMRVLEDICNGRHSPVPVSYTHLDVYKRQILHLVFVV